jgi:alpha/beta hydrolase family protein
LNVRPAPVVDRVMHALDRRWVCLAIVAFAVSGCAGAAPLSTTTVTASASASASTLASVSASARASSPPATPSSAPSAAVLPGRVDMGGRSLFMECRGSGSPTVIFLGGTGADRTQMRTIEDRVLANGTTVCDYDRAGRGKSDPAPKDQTDVDVTDDLAKLLASADLPTPYVLVGQSVGGDQAWLYASRYPDDLAGFLIMNAGFFTLDWEAVKSVWTAAEIAEAQAFVETDLGEVKQAASPPTGVPYVVMMSTIAQCGSPTDVCGRIYPFFEEWGRELARRTPSGRFVELEAGHEIFRDKPSAVVDEIETLLREIP